jgi:hypothetical protein
VSPAGLGCQVNHCHAPASGLRVYLQCCTGLQGMLVSPAGLCVLCHAVPCCAVLTHAVLFCSDVCWRAGNWQWELHQRHQHLIRRYQAQGQDTAGLQAAFEAYLAAERERVQLQQPSSQQQEAQGKCLCPGFGFPPFVLSYVFLCAHT